MTVVLFACVHNAGRSQMAAAWFNRLCDPGKARAISAGTQPAAHVHPEVVAAMREVGLELSSVDPQQLSLELATEASFLITMGCGDACPVVPGARRDDWPLDDPKGQPLELVRAIRDEIRARVAAFILEHGWQPGGLVAALRVRPAERADWDDVVALLQAADLPLGGLTDQYPTAYFMAIRDDRVVGVVGLERYGPYGLLRSLAVASDVRSGGIGGALIGRAQEMAAELGICETYLLTSTAASFVERHGFVPWPRDAAPEPVRASPEFASICPAHATCLRWCRP